MVVGPQIQPQRLLQGSNLVHQHLPICHDLTQSRTSEQSTPRRNTQGGGLCCGDAATNVADSIEVSPRATPTRRKSRRKSLDQSQTPVEWHYSVDPAGDIIKNQVEKAVLEYAYSISWNIFRFDLLTEWPKVSKDSKNYFIQCLHDTYPQPAGAPTFNKERMLQRIGRLLSARASSFRSIS